MKKIQASLRGVGVKRKLTKQSVLKLPGRLLRSARNDGYHYLFQSIQFKILHFLMRFHGSKTEITFR